MKRELRRGRRSLISVSIVFVIFCGTQTVLYCTILYSTDGSYNTTGLVLHNTIHGERQTRVEWSPRS